MSNLTDALIAAKLVGGSGGSGGGSGLPDASGQADNTALSVQSGSWAASGSVLPPIINIMAEIVPSGTLSFSPSNDLYMSIVSFTPVNGSSYVVAWDDTDYEVTARYDEDYGVFVGNLSIVDETADTGEPFVIVGHNGAFYIVTKNSAATHVVAISGYTQSPPDNYVLSVDGGEWKAMPNEGGALICHVNNDTGEFDVTWQQIFDALSQGKRVMSVYTNHNSAMQIVLYIAKKNSNSYDIYDTTRTSGSTPIASCTSANAHPVYK